MFTVRATKKFLDRVGRPVPDPPVSSTVLGDWYANILFWRPQVALFVNASTFVPVLMPMAPAAGVVGRFPTAMAGVFSALGIEPHRIGPDTTGEHEHLGVTDHVDRKDRLRNQRRLPLHHHAGKGIATGGGGAKDRFRRRVIPGCGGPGSSTRCSRRNPCMAGPDAASSSAPVRRARGA